VGKVGDRHFVFLYGDGARFAVRRDGREIWVEGPEGYSWEDLATYLVGPVMGFVLRLFGKLPLHACAVAVRGKAIALMGPQGAGKSTAAAAFAKLGYPVLTEDVLALAEDESRFMAQLGYPRVNLWPESAEALFGAVHDLPVVTPAWGKHFLPLNEAAHRFQSEPLELGAIFILQDRVAGDPKPRIEKTQANAAIPLLIANTYVNYLLDSRMRQEEFRQIARLLHSTPVYRVWPSDDASRIYELCDLISAKVRQHATCDPVP
jgi:hypothetical protein